MSEADEALPLPARRRLPGVPGDFAPISWGMWRFASGNPDLDTAERRVRAALEAGIALLDTADIYGWNGTSGFGDAESLLGKVLAASPTLRERIVLATKGGIRPPLPYDQTGAYLGAALDASLRRLRTERVELYQIHRPDLLAHPQEVARFLDGAIASGKVGAVGVSNFTLRQVDALASFLDHELAATQPEISALEYGAILDGRMDQAMRMGLLPLAWSPLAGGRLMTPQTERERAVAEALDAVCAGTEHSRDIAAYSWLMAHPAGIVPIVGSQNPERIAQAARALEMRWTRRQWYDVLVAARGERMP